MQDLHAMLEHLVDLEAWILDGFGVLAGILLCIIIRLVLPRARRSLLRLPISFIALNLVTALSYRHWPTQPAPTVIRNIALWFLLLAVGRLGFLLIVESILNRTRKTPMPQIMSDIVQTLVYAAATVIALRYSGVEPTSIFTTSALLTAVVGFALQETLGNLVAGVAIQMQRPFDIGDWIQFSADRLQVGRVIEINWRATKLFTEDLVEVVIPNGPLAKNSIVNFSKPSPIVRRSVFVSAPMGVPPARVHTAILSALKVIPQIQSDPPARVLTNGFNFKDNSIEYWVQFFISKFDERDTIDATVRDRIWYALDRAQLASSGLTLTDVELKDVIKHLHRVDFIKALEEDAVRNLASSIRKLRYAPGERVINEGDPGDELFIISRGVVRVLVREKEVAQLPAGSFFGEMSLLTGEKRSATVVAAEDSELYVVTHAAFDEVLKASPDIAAELSRTLAARQLALDKVKAEAASEAALEQRSTQLLGRIKAFFSLK